MIKEILTGLMNGDLSVINSNSCIFINSRALAAFNDPVKNYEEIRDIITISQILYNNTDMSLLPLEDGVYDLLLELYRAHNPNVPVGAPVVYFKPTEQVTDTLTLIKPITIMGDKNEMIFFEDLVKRMSTGIMRPEIKPITFESKQETYVTKRKVAAVQQYPELVGTLNKCKFVLISQAGAKGVAHDPKVLILERDFFQKHISTGILDPKRKFKMVLELKYDGISGVGTVSNHFKSAFTRGDTDDNMAADLTDILKHYIFPEALKYIPDDEEFGLKCEIMMSYYDLMEYSRRRNKKYANPRNTIAGLCGASDAADFVDLITVMPISTTLGLDRLTELEFLNMYFAKEPMRYTVIEGTYLEILFLIKRFVEEAELMRSAMPFMYDGVVVSYIDEDLIESLGRFNSTNQYSIAIKFNPLKKQTVLRGISITVGQNGYITPMADYDPIEFFGNIQTKSSLHSYERFMSLGLRLGDILDAEYSHDVMTYITKPDNSHNAENQNPLIQFPTHCPACETELVISDSGKSAYCTNINCPGRILSRIVNMMKKLNLKDFAEENLRKINKYSLKEMMDVTLDELLKSELGEENSYKFIERMTELKTKPIEDYKIMGAIGFSDLAKAGWRLILNKFTLSEIYNMDKATLYDSLIKIKGIGSVKATVVVEEMDTFRADIEFILSLDNVIVTKGMSLGKKIRFTGFRNADLVEKLNDLGCDADDNASVTKDTAILLVKSADFQSPKVDKAREYGALIIPVAEFLENIELYI